MDNIGAHELELRRIVGPMIMTLLLSLEGSSPEVSRLVNVSDNMHLGSFATLIDAAFGFSGTTNHIYISDEDGKRTLYTAAPGAEEKDETTLAIGDIGEMTYVYDPAANWTIRLDVLGITDVDSPAPLLVDAQGPDVIEACGGPEMMTAFYHEARRLAAGLEPDMRVSPLLLSFMPVMSPERLIERLSTADHSTVAERMAFTSEDFFMPAEPDFTSDPHTPNIADDFDAFINSRPDLQQIISFDPNPERNPAIISAMSEFFADHLPDGAEFDMYPFTRMINNLRTFIYHCVDGVKLTKKGMLRAGDVRTLAENIGLTLVPGNHTAEAVPPLNALRAFLEFRQFLVTEDNYLRTSLRGLHNVEDPNNLIDGVEENLYVYFDTVYNESALNVFRWVADPTGVTPPPRDPEFVVNLFIALGILEEGSTPDHIVPTVPGDEVLGIYLTFPDE